ncbi:AbrB/MazE/SpoVT family DNA-binding domain-containing protein [Candidatus Bathyarchaeota archaeon]|nr:AbrB/MazE/SpoVT family DNA-binding domain-containing protein [Candidatus Bathyarchaeota archaeon]MBS7617104.1 AbrB/MazE/SpoVT family DNA-binding domain-containing protein [Candidatus Bathyarchaeota archaeon]
MSVMVGRYGRIVLPKEIRDKYKVNEGSRLIIRESEREIMLISVNKYDKPTEALYGSITPSETIEEPKKFARECIKRKLAESFRSETYD